MTTATAPKRLQVTQVRVARSEWTKLRSLRSTVWTLLVAVLLTVGIGAVVSAVTASQYDRLDAAMRASFTPIGTSLSGVAFAQIAIGVLGVLFISSEYGKGMIWASLTVVPRRLPVLWGKLAVYAAVVLSVGLASTLGAFLLGQSLLGSHGVSLSSGGAARSVIGAALYLMLAGVMAVAVGTLLRSTAGGISTFVGVFFLLTPLSQLLPTSWTSHFVQYFPSNAGAAMFGGTMNLVNALSPGEGLSVLSAWTIVLVAAAAWRLRRADA